jgi:hypothetical protein
MGSSRPPPGAPPAPPGGSQPPPRSTRLTEPQPVQAHLEQAVLQVVLVFRGQIIGYRLLTARRKITLGPSKRATFVTPALVGTRGRFVLVAPARKGYRLRLSPALTGDLHVGGRAVPVAEALAEPPVGRHRGKGDVRDVLLESGDRAKLAFVAAPELRMEVRWVAPPERIPRPATSDPTIFKIGTPVALILGALAALLMIMWQKTPPKTLAISPERMAKIEEPVLEAEKTVRKVKEAAEKKKAEEGQMKKAKDKAGKLGRADAKEKDTIIPKGKEDILREKVSKVGLLGLIGKSPPQGSGLSKLFAQNTDLEQAVAGMAGAKMVAGRGAGGLSTSGAGPGGGGTGYGHIYGAGNLDTGGRGTHGHGRGPKLGDRGEKEVGVSMGGGTGETDGSLSKEQINKVVRAHLAGVKYCYEKELQHKSGLSGGLDVFWVILPDGTVQKASIKSTTLGDAAVEGCILRQVKQWQFPKAPGQTIVGRYPFIFKGGS